MSGQRIVLPCVVLLALPSILLAVFQQDTSETRVWISKDGRVTIRASFVAFEGDRVRLQRDNGKTLLTDPANLSVADQKFLKELREKVQPNAEPTEKHHGSSDGDLSVATLRARENKLIHAKEILAFYEQVQSEGRIKPESAVYVANKISKFQPLAKLDAIDFDQEFVPKSEIPARRDQAKQLVDEWIVLARKSKGKVEFDQLKQASKICPIALDSTLLQGMHEYFHSRDYAKSMKSFKDAYNRGRKYQSIHEGNDANNFICALNACAVNSVRSGNTDKVFDFLSGAAGAKADVPDEIRKNLTRVARFARFGNAGVTINKSQSRNFEMLFDQLSLSVGGSNGWVFPFPYSQSGQHEDLGFLLGLYADGVGQTKPGCFEDFVCLICVGSGSARCPHFGCVQGVIKVPTFVDRVLPNGDVVKVRINIPKKCPTCSGDGYVKCWGCEAQGVQRR